jgi:uncharacterized protein (DUF433 family)
MIAMTQGELLQRISIDPGICFGKPCIRGHRICVSLILDLLAAGTTVDEILHDYPQLVRDDVLACIAYGSEMSRERYVAIPVTKPCVKFALDEMSLSRGGRRARGASSRHAGCEMRRRVAIVAATVPWCIDADI